MVSDTTTTIRCIRVQTLGKMEMTTIHAKQVRPLASNHVRIAVHFAGVNFADLLLVDGSYQERPKLPFTPGGEVAGLVIESASPKFSLGDRVLAMSMSGGYSEQVVVDVDRVWKVPPGITMEIAASVAVNFGTAMMSLKRCSAQKGETLLVTGASGGTGSAAILVGKAMGMKVVALARGAAKVEHCEKRLHADHVIDCSGTRMKQAIDSVRTITKGKGVSVVIDTVGGPFWPHLLRGCGWGSRVVLVGFASSEIPRIPANLLLVKNISVHGLYFGGHFSRGPENIQFGRQCVEETLNLISQRSILPQSIVTSIIPLENADLAHQSLRRGLIGKIVLSTQPMARL